MADYTDSLGFNKGTAAFPANVTEVSKFSVELDFADIVAARSAAGATALVAGDTLQVIALPAGSVVLSAGLQVTEQHPSSPRSRRLRWLRHSQRAQKRHRLVCLTPRAQR